MTATGATARPTAVEPRTVAGLARLEMRYALRSPLLWLGAVVTALLSWQPLLDGTADPATAPEDPTFRLDLALGPLALAAFVVADWAALRERPTTTEELFGTTSARRWERTAGLLGAAAVPALLAAVVTGVRFVLLLRTDGVPIGADPWTATLAPTPVEALGGPLAVGCVFVAGVAFARVVRSRTLGAVVGFLGYALPFVVPALWVSAPFAFFAVSRTAASATDLGSAVSPGDEGRWSAIYPPGDFATSYVAIDRDLGLYAAHLVAVAGIALALAGLALVRSGQDRRSWALLLGGLAVAVAGIVTQLLLHEGAREWMGLV